MVLENVVVLFVIFDVYLGGKRICRSDPESSLTFSCEGQVGLGYGK